MDGTLRNPRPDGELFLREDNNSPQQGAESPTVAPLRIHRPANATSSPPPPPSQAYPSPHSNTASPQSLPSQAYSKPLTSPPNRPLPYPDYTRRPTPPAAQQANGDQPQRPDGTPPTASISYPYPTPSYLTSSTSSQPSALAARRGNMLKPLPDSPGPETPDKEDLFQRPINITHRLAIPGALNGPKPDGEPQSAITDVAYSYYGHANPAKAGLQAAVAPKPLGPGVNRLASTASISTTRGSRGSPPPPETPIDFPAGGIEARYAAAGIAGESTLNALQAQSLQSQSLASQQRRAEYAHTPPAVQQPTQQPQARPTQHPQTTPRRPWTPTEEPGSAPHGPALTYHGDSESGSPSRTTQPTQTAARTISPPRAPRESILEQDMQNLQIADEPPPAYSSLANLRSNYPDEKGRQPQPPQTIAATKAHVQASMSGPTTSPGGPADTDVQNHPMFANHPSLLAQPGRVESPGSIAQAGSPAPSQASQGRSSPPPLPEGWIAHLDPNSGQYYYIHLPTQSTQWEFPKGPTPLSMNEVPSSPTGTFVNPFASPVQSKFPTMQPLASPGFGTPGFAPQQTPFRQDSISLGGLSSPTAAGFSFIPPVSGHEQYRIAPTNGVYFGPYLRYTNMDVDNGVWFGSVMLITDAPHPPTIHLHQSADLSPNPRQLKTNHIYQHRRHSFYRYDIDVRMEDLETRWTYAITSHLGCTRYEFVIAGRNESGWRFVAHSGNDFALNVNTNERTKLGGVGYMWKDVLQKHQEVGGFHAQLGMGNQIYADRLWKEIPLLRQWTATSGKENRKNAPWTPQHEEEVTHAYFHFYTSHLDQPLLREAFAQIPHVLTLDDHEIFDGFGSYPDYMQSSHMVKNIGRIGVEMYLLFQHHTTISILRNVRDDLDLFTITGTGWHFIKYLGPGVVVVGPDCRSERTQTQVMAGPTYQGLFPKVVTLPPSVQHAIWLIPVPIVYPRLEAAEQFAQTFATGKKVATGTFNALGKVTSSVAGIVGAKGVVGEGFNSVKKAVGKSGLMSNVLSPFGELDVSDELRDQWTHESKDLERTYLIRTLQTIASSKSIRMTFFSGATNCCGVGLLHDPSQPSNHKTMYQVISSSVVNAPPSTYVLRMLQPSSNGQTPPIYVPQNGHRSGRHGNGPPTDTKEDMLEIFGGDGANQGMKRLMGRRNYAVVLVFDPEAVEGAFNGTGGYMDSAGSLNANGKMPGSGMGRVSLAVDLMVQSDQGMQMQAGSFTGGQSLTIKYGPIIVPNLEYGR